MKIELNAFITHDYEQLMKNIKDTNCSEFKVISKTKRTYLFCNILVFKGKTLFETFEKTNWEANIDKLIFSMFTSPFSYKADFDAITFVSARNVFPFSLPPEPYEFIHSLDKNFLGPAGEAFGLSKVSLVFFKFA